MSFLLFFTMQGSQAQKLEAEWNGWFKYRYDAVSIPGIPLTLKFLFNKDSTYTVYSYTPFDYYKKKKHIYDTTVCLVEITRLTTDSIFLEEKKALDLNPDAPDCYQKMNLKIIPGNDQRTLSGLWESTGKNCKNSGSIGFIRKNK